MLKRINDPDPRPSVMVPIRDACFPSPFPVGLEFDSPVHGVWNIVHTGMLIPGAHQIYVCAANCMRGVVLTAAEMNCADRFSFVILEEKDLLQGTVEKVTIDGVADVLRKLPKLPPMVLLFTVCLHHFLGSDLNYIYKSLEEQFPEVTFVQCYMDPIMQKRSKSADIKTRRSIYDALPQCKCRSDVVTLLGNDHALGEDCDLVKLLQQNGIEFRQLPAVKDYDEYLALSEAGLFLSVYPNAVYGASHTAQRLGRKHLYLPQSFSYSEITYSLNTLCDALNLPKPDLNGEIQSCEEALNAAASLLGNTPVAIDYAVHPRPIGLARLLLDHGIQVTRVYMTAISKEDHDDYIYLQAHYPNLMLVAAMRPGTRVLSRNYPCLAIGQKAAWFTGTKHFVNLAEGAGLWGFDGIRKLCGMITDAYQEEKEPDPLILRKGLGCDSCI